MQHKIWNTGLRLALIEKLMYNKNRDVLMMHISVEIKV